MRIGQWTFVPKVWPGTAGAPVRSARLAAPVTSGLFPEEVDLDATGSEIAIRDQRDDPFVISQLVGQRRSRSSDRADRSACRAIRDTQQTARIDARVPVSATAVNGAWVNVAHALKRDPSCPRVPEQQ